MLQYMSYNLNSLKGGSVGYYLGDHDRGYSGGYLWDFLFLSPCFTLSCHVIFHSLLHVTLECGGNIPDIDRPHRAQAKKTRHMKTTSSLTSPVS